MSQYYVYSLCYPNGEPFYIGKGQRDRIDMHEKEVQKGRISNPCKAEIIKHIQSSGQEVLKQKLAEFSSEQEAYMYEWALIHMTAYNEHLANCLIMQGPYRENSPIRPKRKVFIEKSDGMYTLDEMVAMTGLSQRTIYRLIEEGRITTQKIPPTRYGHHYISQTTVDEFFQPIEPTPKKKERRIMPIGKIYSAKEVAEILGIIPITVQRRIREGKLKAFRTNGSSGAWRIREEDLQAFLDTDTNPELATVQRS